MKKCIKQAVVMFCLLIGIVLLSGCESTRLAEGFDAADIKQQSEEIINDVQLNGAKQVLQERIREDFIDQFDLDEMDNTVRGYTNGLGAFLTYSQESVIGKHYKDTDEDFAVALITANYEKGEVLYTLTFDKEMTLVGFYAKN